MKKATIVIGDDYGILNPSSNYITSMQIDHLVELDKDTALEVLKLYELPELWNHFLRVQADLFFEHDAAWLANEKWWKNSKNVLEIGSGNGIYLDKLSARFSDKKYLGIEKQLALVEQSRETFANHGIEFAEGDAEIENMKYFGQFDIVLFRLILQHLKSPWLALNNASKYLKQSGHLIIIDSFDPSMRSSHVIASLEEASQKHKEVNQAEGKGNRLITMEILTKISRSDATLNAKYDLIFSNLNQEGEILKKIVVFENDRDRKLYFIDTLLFLDILNKGWKIPVNFSTAYDELNVYVRDPKSWVHPGMHYLVLKKQKTSKDVNR